MIILAVDDRHKALEVLTESIREAEPDATVLTCAGGMEALSQARKRPVDVAFIDIDMPEMDGITLARRLKLQYPRINIVFATAYREYMGDAFDLRASGYVLKPITPEKVRAEMENLRYQLKTPPASDRRVCFRCFGNFDVFIDNRPVQFHYDKAKEMLAYLVDRRSVCTNQQIMSALWDKDVSGSYFRTLRKELLDTFRDAGCEDVLIQQWGKLGIAMERVSCDFYDWIKGIPSAINAYWGSYMEPYEWAVFTNSYLERRETQR